MEITYDLSVNAEIETKIEVALTACTFPLDFLPVNVTVTVAPNVLGHGGRFEAVTTYPAPGRAAIQFAPGLFTPGDPLYVDEAFISECVIHEIGHVVTVACLTGAEEEPFGSLLGFDFATQWATDPSWEDRGVEAVAEVFKDLFAPPAYRHFLNRTHFQIEEWALGYFATQCFLALRDREEFVATATVDVGAPVTLTLPAPSDGQWIKVDMTMTGPMLMDSTPGAEIVGGGGRVFSLHGLRLDEFTIDPATEGVVPAMATNVKPGQHDGDPRPITPSGSVFLRDGWHVEDAPIFIDCSYAVPYTSESLTLSTFAVVPDNIHVVADVTIRTPPPLAVSVWPYPAGAPAVPSSVQASQGTVGVVR